MKVIKIDDENYPESLKNIYDPPKTLFVMGNEKILNEFGIGIVGTRSVSSYGREITRMIAFGLAKRGINVISGMALRSRYNGTYGCTLCKRKDDCGFR